MEQHKELSFLTYRYVAIVRLGELQPEVVLLGQFQVLESGCQ